MELRDILKNTRIGEPSENNIKSLMSLQLNSGILPVEQIQAIEDHALYIFANKKLMKELNRERLHQQHSVTNPVVRLKVQSTRNSKKVNNIPRCFKQDNDIEPIINICRGA